MSVPTLARVPCCSGTMGRQQHRLSAMADHLVGGGGVVAPEPLAAAAAAAAAALPSASHASKPLSERQLTDWLADGVLVLPVDDFGPEWHTDIYRRAEELQNRNHQVERGQRRAHVVRELPELTEVVRSPSVAGALESVLGPGYAMHPHRALHTSGSGDQQFHKDGHHLPMRSHRARFIMAMYYPEKVTEDMGPTR